MKKKYNVIDLFAGCGGLSEGFLQSGRYNFLAHIEWEMPMVETLRNNLNKRWGYSEDDDVEMVRVHVRHLRSKIEKIAPKSKYIQTVYGGGYKLNPTNEN